MMRLYQSAPPPRAFRDGRDDSLICQIWHIPGSAAMRSVRPIGSSRRAGAAGTFKKLQPPLPVRSMRRAGASGEGETSVLSVESNVPW